MNRSRLVSALVVGACLFAGRETRAHMNAQPAHARGSFDVKVTTQTGDGAEKDASLGRMSIDKTFEGDLQGTSRGEMLTAMGSVKGSAVYVAIERVTGTIDGRSGTFVLAHRGTMTRGAQSLEITVVPDSGTGQLAGISGTMAITIVNGKHLYDLEYSLVEDR
jgi:hypothetical protein